MDLFLMNTYQSLITPVSGNVLGTRYSVMKTGDSAPGLRVLEEAAGQSVVLSQAVSAAVEAQALGSASSGTLTPPRLPTPPCFRLGTIPGDSETLV